MSRTASGECLEDAQVTPPAAYKDPPSVPTSERLCYKAKTLKAPHQHSSKPSLALLALVVVLMLSPGAVKATPGLTERSARSVDVLYGGELIDSSDQVKGDNKEAIPRSSFNGPEQPSGRMLGGAAIPSKRIHLTANS